MTFLNKGSIGLTLDHLPAGCQVIIDGSKSRHIDYDVLEIIQDFQQHTAPRRTSAWRRKGIKTVKLVGAH